MRAGCFGENLSSLGRTGAAPAVAVDPVVTVTTVNDAARTSGGRLGACLLLGEVGHQLGVQFLKMSLQVVAPRRSVVELDGGVDQRLWYDLQTRSLDCPDYRPRVFFAQLEPRRDVRNSL